MNLLLHVKNLSCFHSVLVKGFLESRHVQGRAEEEQDGGKNRRIQVWTHETDCVSVITQMS